MTTTGTQRLPRGYEESPETISLKSSMEETTSFKSTSLLVVDQVLTLASCIGLAFLWMDDRVFALIFAAPLLLIIARSLRATEMLTHEASHHNLCRKSNAVNDGLANLLSAVPVGTTVARYRASHLVSHHGKFASGSDPCLERFVTAEFAELPLDRGYVAFALAVASRLPRYSVNWWKGVRSDKRSLLYTIAWHAVVWSSIGLVIGWPVALVGLLIWLLAFSALLPAIRLVGESEEHDYSASTEFAGTYSSLGRLQRVVFHPHGDGYHAEHHRYPRVPHHHLRQTRQELLALDESWKLAPVRHRVVARTRPSVGQPAVSV
jgi:fatty acid desaturase